VSRPGPLSERFRRADRLTRRRDFETCYSKGIRVPGRLFSLHARPNGSGVHRLGLSVSRRVGSAVMRNRVRRRIREAFRRGRPADAQTDGLDLVLHVYPAAGSVSSKVLREELWKAIAKARRPRM
jgi:ribonuclease P protein component